MRAYTDQVAAGVEEAAAMRDAGWLPDQEPATTPAPAADLPAVNAGVVVDLDTRKDLRDDGGQVEPATGVGRSRVIKGELVSPRIDPPDEQHFPDQPAVEAGAVGAVLAEQGLDQARHAALPAAAALGRT